MLSSTKNSTPLRYFYTSMLSLFVCLRFSYGNDVFCGNLTVYRRKWSLENAMVPVSRTTNDLKQCLHICCSLSDCQGVTFIGVVERNVTQENCLLARCYGQCQLDNNSTELFEGVSVKITRTIQNSAFGDLQPPKDDLSMLPRDNTLNSKLSPIWAIGLVIVASVFCVAFNVTLISAYICWQRRKNNKRKAHISTIRTLHAFNPT